MLPCQNHLDAEALKKWKLNTKIWEVSIRDQIHQKTRTLTKDQKELIRHHIRLNHVKYITDMQLITASGNLQKLLYTCKRPAFDTCYYRIAHINTFRRKGNTNEDIFSRLRNFPSEVDHIGNIISSVPGLMPQIVGFLTSTKFKHIYFFFDDRSVFTCVHHQTSTPAE